MSRGNYEFEYEMPISAPGHKGPADINVIALLLNRSTGESLNAGKGKITDADPGSGIDSAEVAAAAQVAAGKGSLSVTGEFDSADVYSLDGARRGTLNAEGSLTLAPGVYVVRIVSGARATSVKTVVR